MLPSSASSHVSITLLLPSRGILISINSSSPGLKSPTAPWIFGFICSTKLFVKQSSIIKTAKSPVLASNSTTVSASPTLKLKSVPILQSGITSI